MVYVVSDIHGNKKAFDSILEKINLRSEDELYVLGDVIDRHPDGITLLQQIMRTPNMNMLLGNHEYMMMDALGFPYDKIESSGFFSFQEKKHLWFYNSGKVTYNAWKSLSENEQIELKSYLQNIPLNYDVEVNSRHFKLVHATWSEMYTDFAEDDGSQYKSKAHFSVWDRDSVMCMADIENVTTIFGHTPTYNFTHKIPMEVYRYKNAIAIDCGAGLSDYGRKSAGRLACLCLNNLQVVYSNE